MASKENFFSLFKNRDHIILKKLLKLCQNLVSFKWLKSKRSVVSKFTLTRSCIEKNRTTSSFKNLNINVLDTLKNSTFLIVSSNNFIQWYSKDKFLSFKVEVFRALSFFCFFLNNFFSFFFLINLQKT